MSGASKRQVGSGGISLRAWGRRWGAAIAVLVALAWAVGLALWTPTPAGVHELLSPEDRADERRHVLLFRSRGDGDARARLTKLSRELATQLGDKRWPATPPRTELSSWYDRHALYFVPPEQHDELRARLQPEAARAAIAALGRRITSPLWGLSGEDPRRDPLRVSELAQAGHTLGVVRGWATEPSVTASGDLISSDGRMLVVLAELDDGFPQLLAELAPLLGDDVTVEAWGPRVTAADQARRTATHGPRVALVAWLAATAVLALALRRAVGAIATSLTIAGLLLAAHAGLGHADDLTLPLWAAALGVGIEGALRVQRISSRGWPAAAVFALSLAPLALLPEPLWDELPWRWAAIVGVATLAARWALPGVLSVTRADVNWPSAGLRLRPSRAMALLLLTTLLACGAWASSKPLYAGADQVGADSSETLSETLRDHFFDPRRIAHIDSQGTAEQALEHASEWIFSRSDADGVRRVDSPALLMLPAQERERREQALRALNPASRSEALEVMLGDEGMRPEAFHEFTRGLLQPEHAPGPKEVLEGRLGGWARRYHDEGRARLRSFVELGAIDGVGHTQVLRGPIVARAKGRAAFGDQLGLLSLMQLLLGGVIVALATRSIALSVAAMLCGLATQSGAMFGMMLLGQPVGPHLLPVFLLVGALGQVACARCCRAVDAGAPVVTSGVLAAATCQAATGIAMLAAPVPSWQHMGILLAVGSVLAAGVGLFAGPGLALTLRTLRSEAQQPRTEEAAP